MAERVGRESTSIASLVKPRTKTRDIPKPPPGTESPGDSLVQRPPPAAAMSSDVVRRMSRMLLLRTLIVTVVLGLSTWLLLIAEQPSFGALWLDCALIAATYVTSIVFGLLLRRRGSTGALGIARAMQTSDLVVTTLFVWISGGAQSPYIFLYAFSIVGAAVVFARRGAVTVGAAAMGSMVVVAVLAWTNAIPLPMPSGVRPWLQPGADLMRTLGIDFAALIGVGALAYIFGEQMERTGETLATTRRAAADLLSLHQDIVRSLSSGLVTISPDGTVLTANAAASEILRKGELTAKAIDDVMPGMSRLIEESGRRADLEIAEGLVIGVTVSLLRDVHDQVIGRVINFQDLSELRRLEAHMNRAERLATVGQLAAGVAHEIRNPLASISGSIELLASGPTAAGSEDDKALMAIVTREIARLNQLIGELLEYASPRPKQTVELDVGVLVGEILQVAAADKKFAEIDVQNAVEQPCLYVGDPAKLRQVVWNLLRNAGDAATKIVRVEVRSQASEVRIVVKDDGAGIPADQLARIFDPFFTTKKSGTGLGLATCHAIVAEHGGRIDVDSEVGHGTTMTVVLPRLAQ